MSTTTKAPPTLDFTFRRLFEACGIVVLVFAAWDYSAGEVKVRGNLGLSYAIIGGVAVHFEEVQVFLPKYKQKLEMMLIDQ